MNGVDPRATATTRARYDRRARFYDRMTRGSERVMTPGRAALWQRVRGPRVLVVRMIVANTNRETVENVRRAGFIDVQVEDLWLDIVKRIAARTPGLAAVA